MSFYADEVQRLQDAELILLGVAPSELERMSMQQREDVLALYDAKARLTKWQMRRKK